ncbi:unnamed protein product [Lampetra fluviatilis]
MGQAYKAVHPSPLLLFIIYVNTDIRSAQSSRYHALYAPKPHKSTGFNESDDESPTRLGPKPKAFVRPHAGMAPPPIDFTGGNPLSLPTARRESASPRPPRAVKASRSPSSPEGSRDAEKAARHGTRTPPSFKQLARSSSSNGGARRRLKDPAPPPAPRTERGGGEKEGGGG